MTPADYSRMRGILGTSSGFQSDQYRMLEFLLGNRAHAMLDVFAGDHEVRATLRDERARPSLYDEALLLLARAGVPIQPSGSTATGVLRPRRPVRSRLSGRRSMPSLTGTGICTNLPKS